MVLCSVASSTDGWNVLTCLPGQCTASHSRTDWRLAPEQVAQFYANVCKLPAHSPGRQYLPRQNHQQVADVVCLDDDLFLETSFLLNISLTLPLVLQASCST